ncbi:MAG: transglycosylase SLT domain-containing protein [Candidatus Saccharimonadales bacterium]
MPRKIESPTGTHTNAETIADAAYKAGFRGHDLITAVAVALAESGGNRVAISPTQDYGLWQINKPAHANLFHGDAWRHVNSNADMAHKVFKSSGWTAWSTFKSGKYKQYMGQANKAIHGNSSINPEERALAYAAFQSQHATQNWFRLCDEFVAKAYGLPSSGYNTALDQWHSLPKNEKFTRGSPKPGDLMFFSTPNNPDGHVALYAGRNELYSTDYCGAGKVCKVPVSSLVKNWHAKYLGYSKPYFGGQKLDQTKLPPGAISLVNRQAKGVIQSQNQSSNSGSWFDDVLNATGIPAVMGVLQNNPISSTEDAFKAIANEFSVVGKFIAVLLSPTTWIRIQAVIFGTLLALVGLFFLAKAAA